MQIMAAEHSQLLRMREVPGNQVIEHGIVAGAGVGSRLFKQVAAAGSRWSKIQLRQRRNLLGMANQNLRKIVAAIKQVQSGLQSLRMSRNDLEARRASEGRLQEAKQILTRNRAQIIASGDLMNSRRTDGQRFEKAPIGGFVWTWKVALQLKHRAELKLASLLVRKDSRTDFCHAFHLGL